MFDYNLFESNRKIPILIKNYHYFEVASLISSTQALFVLNDDFFN